MQSKLFPKRHCISGFKRFSLKTSSKDGTTIIIQLCSLGQLIDCQNFIEGGCEEDHTGAENRIVSIHSLDKCFSARYTDT